MTYRNITKALLLLSLAAAVCLVLANSLPGAWWQWLIVSILLLFAAAGASNAADEQEGRPQR